VGRNQRGKQTMRESGLWETNRVIEGRVVGGWGDRVMGIKEGTCWDVHWVLQATNESLNTTTKTYDVLYLAN